MNLLLADELVNGLMVFVIGLIVVFAGMALIVLIISIIGSIMKKALKPAEKPTSEPVKAETVEVKTDEKTDDKLRAAIIAAITAYYFENSRGCDFKVKRIKRL